MFPLYFLYDMWPVLLLRIAISAVLIAHGWPKRRTLFGFLGFLGGLAILVGLLVPWISGLLAIGYIVILLRKLQKRTLFPGGWELDLLMIAGLIILFSLHGGAYSIDRMFFGWL